jgi:hypothetical protein
MAKARNVLVMSDIFKVRRHTFYTGILCVRNAVVRCALRDMATARNVEVMSNIFKVTTWCVSIQLCRECKPSRHYYC